MTYNEFELNPICDMANLIEINNISKVYRDTPWSEKRFTLHAVSLSIPKGTSFGLLGANGAGKTTLMKILLGLTHPTSGTVMVGGCSPRDPKTRLSIGYLPEHIALYPYLTGEEFLGLAARLYRLPSTFSKPRVTDVLHMVGLRSEGRKKLRTYSKGMLQRIGLAQALVHDPEILLLDEPLDGLDPIGRFQMKEILIGLKRKGVTIMLNSHILSDVEEICDTIGILHKGKLLTTGALSKLVPAETTLEQFFVTTIQS